jgi:hypothetical protein
MNNNNFKDQMKKASDDVNKCIANKCKHIPNISKKMKDFVICEDKYKNDNQPQKNSKIDKCQKSKNITQKFLLSIGQCGMYKCENEMRKIGAILKSQINSQKTKTKNHTKKK